MNIDNQLMLGIVFLTAGVAMALLAYAALLNRRSGEEEDEREMLPPVDEPAIPEAEVSEAQPEPSPEPPELASAPEPTLPSPPLAAEESETPSPAPAADPETAAPPPQAMLLREEQSDRLVVQIGDSIYRSIEDLRDSPDWQRVDNLFSDLLAWMIKAEATDRAKQESSKGSDQPANPSAPLSMIEQINEILSAKLAEQPDTTTAVHLMEGSDGTIRVYIGVNSYSIEDVPDEEVRALIRQAVAEWESQQ
ncbi:MAG: hypothetical protein WBR18_01350 [Anaerolineales bacterium]